MNELTHSLTTNKMAVNMSWRKHFQPSVPLIQVFFSLIFFIYVSPLNLTSRGRFRPFSLRSVSFLILFIYFKCTVMCMWILYFQVYSIGLYIQSDYPPPHFSPYTDELIRLLNMEIDQCIHLAV